MDSNSIMVFRSRFCFEIEKVNKMENVFPNDLNTRRILRIHFEIVTYNM